MFGTKKHFMIMRIIISICMCLCLSQICHAQDLFQIRIGKIVSTEGEAIPYANVIFLDENNKVASFGVSTEQGYFVAMSLKPGTYKIEISCIGYEPLKDTITITSESDRLGTFQLQAGIQLQEAVVKGYHMIQMGVDRLIYDVEQDTTAYRSKALDILGKLPFVTIDPKSKNLQVMGGSNYAITVNGRKSLFLSEANQYVAQLLQADKMKTIELVMTPTGRYADKTAVINIVTSGSLPDGIVGNLLVDANHEYIRPDLAITSKIKKFIYQIEYVPEYQYYHKLNSQSLTLNHLDSVRYRTETAETEWSRDHRQDISLRASYDLNERNLLTLSGNYAFYKEKVYVDEHSRIADITGKTVEELDAENRGILKNNAFKASLNYQKTFNDQSDRMLTATYSVEHNADHDAYRQTRLNGTDAAVSKAVSTNRLRLTEHTLGVDYSHPFNERHSYFVTGKTVLRHYGSDGTVQSGDAAPVAGEDLTYNQQVYSLTGSYTWRHKKFMLMPQVSFEATNNRMRFSEIADWQNKCYLDIIPHLLFVYQMGIKSSWTISYSKPAFRPDIYYLNPFVNDSDPTHIIVGNPALKPEKKHVFNLNYFFFSPKFEISAGANYAYSSNAIYPYDYVNGDGIRTTTYGNIGRSNLLALNWKLRYRKVNKFDAWINGSATYSHYSYNENDYPLWNFTASAGANVHIGQKLLVEAVGHLTPLSTSLQSTSFHYFIGGALRASYDFTPRLTAMVDVDKFWKKHLTGEEEKDTPTFYYHEKEELYGRTITLTVQYVFGRLNSQVKQSKRGIINSDRSK